MPDQLMRVHADPSKAFFIDMLIKDIGVTDCILDLIDNAVDRAVERSQVDVMELLERGGLSKKIEGARIEIEFSPTSFRMTDTCGGISVEDARETVFKLGNPDERGASHGLSVYGIGMKRAFFKLGDLINVRSATETEYFEITIDVPDWKSKPEEWWFEFDAFGPRAPSRRIGTEIHIPQLRAGISDRLVLPSFNSELRSRISSTYALFLRAGVEIVVNGDPLPPRMPQLVGEPFQPVRKEFEHGGVKILMVASMAPKNDRSAHGWYVFCNGRMVLEADKTSMTGWGDGMPAFHNKFNHFVGFTYFQSADVRLLPWRTTKQGVERESPVYQAALVEMKLQAKPILDFLGRMYPTDLEPEGVEERELLLDAKILSIEEVTKEQSTFSVKRTVRTKPVTVSIQFTRPRDVVKRVARYLGDPSMSAARVGEHTFDYFVENELA